MGKYNDQELNGTRFSKIMKILPAGFYQRKDVLRIAKELLGKILVTNWEGIITSGRIVECEAYNGIIDKASHAAGGRRTLRNEIMYANGGFSYVYLCYGIHHLFNVVTNLQDVPHAILIRAVEPIEGIGEMLLRTGKKKPDYTLTRGPGNVSKALGIFTKHNGIFLSNDQLYIADVGKKYGKNEIIASPRIGVDYAGRDAKLPYRFYVKDSPYVSGKK
ncbi:MAG: 3-methyladenine glycosylase [Chitinophagaceae bacterium]|nr:3-methyladenine glycosylase [Chitinophagaceae bacterium]